MADGRGENRLLASLDHETRDRLRERLRPVELRRGQVLFEPEQEVASVSLPLRAVVSLLVVVADGRQVELATVGREGAVGLPTLLDERRAIWRAMVQVPGPAFALSMDVLEEEIERSPSLRDALDRYTFALMSQVGQAAACNRLHPVEQRTARWLLLTHDRVGEDEFDMTHQFLSEMLGVRRASVTESAGDLQRRGLIEYRRGRIRITDRAGLEESSCECYETVRSTYDRVLAWGSP